MGEWTSDPDTRLLRLQNAAKSALDAYQKFLDGDDLEVLRDGMTELQQEALCNMMVPLDRRRRAGEPCRRRNYHEGEHR